MQADDKTDIAVVEKRIAERNAEAARQEARLLLAVTGLIVAVTAIFAFMIRAGG